MDKQKPVTDWKSGLPETPCGKGSMFENTEEIREWLPEMIEKYNIQSLADIGCGDENWIHACLPEGVAYQGYDIMPRRVDVKTFDVTREVLPAGYDMALCIYVLNHVYPDMAERALNLLQMSGVKYLLASYSDADEYGLVGELIENTYHKTRPENALRPTVNWRY